MARHVLPVQELMERCKHVCEVSYDGMRFQVQCERLENHVQSQCEATLWNTPQTGERKGTKGHMTMTWFP